MLYKELKKIIFNIPAVTMVIVALGISIICGYVTVHNCEKEKVKENKYYNEYILRLQGKITEEKRKYINVEYRKIKDNLAKESEMSEKYDLGNITQEEYQNYLNQNFYATEHLTAIERIRKQCKGIVKAGKRFNIQTEFVCDTYWNHYFNMYVMVLLQMLVVMIIVIRYLVSDYTSGMWQMLLSYRDGKTKLLNRKMFATVITCIIISFVFFSTHLVIYSLIYGIGNMKAPIQSILVFGKFPFRLTIGGMVIFVMLWQLMGLCLYGILILAITSVTGNLTTSFGICGTITLLPMVFGMNLKKVKSLSVYEYINGIDIISKITNKSEMIIRFCSFTIIILIIYCIVLFIQSDFRRKLHIS